MSKCFAVKMSYTVVVVAESEDDAEKVAFNSQREIASDFLQRDIEYSGVKTILESKDLPCGWDMDAIPYGPSDARTIAEIVEVTA